MATIRESARQYEDWLRAQLHGDVLEQDLAKKHDKMRESAFVFLRATYWRWPETIFDVCPDLTGGTQVLAVGDIRRGAARRRAHGTLCDRRPPRDTKALERLA
jgi:hypothetical protein